MSSILLTGSNGYLGAACVPMLSESEEIQVIATWNSRTENINGDKKSNVRYVQCNLSDAEAVFELFGMEDIIAIVHAAALLPDTKPSYIQRALSANVASTVNLVQAGQASGCKSFVHCSSVSVYGTTDSYHLLSEDEDPAPEDDYSWSKSVAEQYLRHSCCNSSMSAISLRLSGLHGPGRTSGIFYNVAKAALQGIPVQTTSQSVPFQFLHIYDAVAAIKMALSRDDLLKPGYRVVNVASGIVPSLNDIVTLADCKARIAIPPMVAPKPGKRYQLMSTERLEEWLEWTPHSMEQTLDSSRKWIQRNRL
mgnify:CR=1 FL=1